jgi:hypothetical protein
MSLRAISATKLWVTIIASALAITAACGGGDDDGEAANTTTTHDMSAMSSGSHEDTPVQVDDADRCDLGFNTADFNEHTTLVDHIHQHNNGFMTGDMQVGFTVEEWAEVFTNVSSGVAVADVVNGMDPEPVLNGTFTHTLDPDPWVPMTDAGATLGHQLQTARDAAARYPTVAEALADGYQLSSLYVPGQGAHFSKMPAMDGDFDPAEPEMLMFDGTVPESRLMGMSYFIISRDALPDGVGFAGDNDQWHKHDFVCQNTDGVAVSRRECDPGGTGTLVPVGGWMLHTWVVPGCESDWGLFSGANPRLKLPPSVVSGCSSGKTVSDPPDFDDAGDGPKIR